MGSRDGQADPQCHRLAGPPHGRSLPRTKGEGIGGKGRGEDGAAARSLFLGDQAGMAARSCFRRADEGGARRALLRHRRQLADLQADGRQGARDRRDQRLAHHAAQSEDAGVGRRDAGAVRRARRNVARGARQRRRFRRGGAARRNSDHGRCRRPAGGRVRPGLLQTRRREIDLRHGLLRAGQYRRDRSVLCQSTACDQRLSHRQEDRPMPSRAASSSPARWCNGCAMRWA